MQLPYGYPCYPDDSTLLGESDDPFDGSWGYQPVAEQEKVNAGYPSPEYKKWEDIENIVSLLWKQFPRESIRSVQISPYISIQGKICNVEVRKKGADGKRRYYATVKADGNVITGEIFPNFGDENG